MLHPMRWGVLMAVLVVSALCMHGAVAQAAPATLSTSSIGVVDPDGIADGKTGFTGYQKALERLAKFQKERATIFNDLESGIGLSPEQFAEYKKLAGTAVKMNPARIKELQGLAMKNLGEYQSLAKKNEDAAATMTDAEKTRLAQLEQDIKSVSEEQDRLRDKLNEEVDNERIRLRDILIDLRDKAIAKVAENKKLILVVSRTVQVSDNASEVFVLWGGVDITADVVKILNDGFKETMLDPKK